MTQVTKEMLKEYLLTQAPYGLPSSWFDPSKEAPEEKLAEKTVAEEKIVAKEKEAKKEATETTPDNSKELEALRIEAESCTKCRLSETRTNVVFGVGEVQPRLVFVGEGPGRDEDLQGEPFVGKAGQLLNAAIEKGMKLKRSEVYICNVVKCRPPENRTPLPDEVEACSHYLNKQLELLNPEVIVALGAPAMTALTGESGGITKIRGNWLEWRGIPVMPTFHPAYILRNPPAKKEFWEDLKQVMGKLGL